MSIQTYNQLQIKCRCGEPSCETETTEQRAERIFKEDEIVQQNRRQNEAQQRADTRLAFVNSSSVFTRTDISPRSKLGRFLRYVNGRSHVTGGDEEHSLLKLIRIECSGFLNDKKIKEEEIKTEISRMQDLFEVFDYGY